MTRRIKNVVIIECEPDQECARCHRQRETRPVGSHGERFCFNCTTPSELKEYVRKLFGENLN